MENKKQMTIIIVFAVLIVSNLYFGLRYVSAKGELANARTIIAAKQGNNQTLDFLKMFVKDVIKSDKEVDFDTRLKLENAVRELNDKDILARWQAFVDSKDEIEAQENVKDLLELLIVKSSLIPMK